MPSVAALASRSVTSAGAGATIRTVTSAFSTAPLFTGFSPSSAMVYTWALTTVSLDSSPRWAPSLTLKARVYRSPVTVRPALAVSSRDTAQ